MDPVYPYHRMDIRYSDRYLDSTGYEYRIVSVPYLPKTGTRLLSEAEVRQLGITQSPGWRHYATWTRGQRALLFRRPVNGVTKYNNDTQIINTRHDESEDDVDESQDEDDESQDEGDESEDEDDVERPQCIHHARCNINNIELYQEIPAQFRGTFFINEIPWETQRYLYDKIMKIWDYFKTTELYNRYRQILTDNQIQYIITAIVTKTVMDRRFDVEIRPSLQDKRQWQRIEADILSHIWRLI